MAQPEQRLLAEALKTMEPLGLHFRVLRQDVRNGAHRGDADVSLRFGGRNIRYVVEVKRGLRPATLGAVTHQLATHKGTPLLVTDHVTPPLADALRANGVEFIDAAGNAFLNRPPLLVFVKGQRPTGQETVLGRGRAFQATGLQVLFALLARPELVGRPYREIAVAAGVAHGTVGWVMAELPALGYVAKVGGRRRLVNGQRLLDQWTEAYARTLRPRLLLGRFRGDIEALYARTAQWEEDLLVGGELAAARLTRHLRPGTATFYTQAIDPKVIVKLVLRADAEGNVEFRLLATGDARCLETAQLLRGPLLARHG